MLIRTQHSMLKFTSANGFYNLKLSLRVCLSKGSMTWCQGRNTNSNFAKLFCVVANKVIDNWTSSFAISTSDHNIIRLRHAYKWLFGWNKLTYFRTCWPWYTHYEEENITWAAQSLVMNTTRERVCAQFNAFVCGQNDPCFHFLTARVL
jgi:hypothetical protein